MVDKGVSWHVGRIFFKNNEVWRFDLLPDAGHRRPAFINLQQYYCEGYLYELAAAQPNIELRWRHKAVGVTQHDRSVTLTVETVDGVYDLHADWVAACDGSRSPMRRMIGQESHGRIFRDRFLIADIKMHADFPPERWFWFDPPFHPNQSVLLHSQPDNVWRIDFQLGWDADPIEAVKPENVTPRIQALLGDRKFELEWVSIYTFACKRMDHFRHRRILFAGDAAHCVSPFGARGANSGVQDADNLAWKLDLVLKGRSPEALLDTYAQEREKAADENIMHSTRSTDFITPKSEISLLFRNVTLRLAKDHDFARKLINSGRLSTATSYVDSALNTPDVDSFDARLRVGTAAPDAPVTVGGQPHWWLSQLGGSFVLAVYLTRFPTGDDRAQLARIRSALSMKKPHPEPAIDIEFMLVIASDAAGAADIRADDHESASDARIDAGNNAADFASVIDAEGFFRQRYDASHLAAYLFRPDQHLAARWRQPDIEKIRTAAQRAAGLYLIETKNEHAEHHL